MVQPEQPAPLVEALGGREGAAQGAPCGLPRLCGGGAFSRERVCLEIEM